jgi:hypothetical protein
MSDTKIASRASVYARKYRYGITEEQYDNLLATQDNKCAVCKTEFTDIVRPNIDHDHNCCPGARSCGKCLRGLLCSHCIIFASMMETRFDNIEAMFLYLTKYLKSEVK